MKGLFRLASRSVVLGEREFQAALHREQRRMEHTGRPFLVIRVTAPFLFEGAGSIDSQYCLLRVITSMARHTDTVGWIETGNILGVICTELGGHEAASAGRAILAKIESLVQKHLEPSAVSMLSLSVVTHCRSSMGRGRLLLSQHN